jgi:hypothetical protein
MEVVVGKGAVKNPEKAPEEEGDRDDAKKK